MKLQSLNLLFRQAKETFMRFPLVIFSALIGAFSMIRVIGFSSEYYELHSQFWYNIVMTCTLGVPLFLAFALFAEARKYGAVLKTVIQFIPLLLLLLFYFTLSPELDLFDIGRFFLYLTAFHLLVSFSTVLFSESSQTDFWNFNLTFFLRFLLSALYSAVLYGGLAIALLAFDKLFDMNIDGKRYGQLFFFIAGIFNTWFFCSGIPSMNEITDTEFKYPKGLKIFTQYVLLPIVVVYVVILYMYLFKIVFKWNLPMGWVSYLVIGFSTAGIFSLLLIYPIKDEVKWLRIFTRLFFAALIPQIILLFLAIGKRTSEYGMTERRYYVIVLALWLAVTTLYYIFTNFKNIKYIPISLFLIAILTSAGPWSSFTLSLNSQMSRLEEVLNKNSILVEGKIVKAKTELTKEELSDVKSIIEFLNERRKINKIQPWFNENLDDIAYEKRNPRLKSRDYISKEQKIMELMGLKYFKEDDFKSKKFLSVHTKNINEISIKDFDYFFVYENQAFDSTKKVFEKSEMKTEIFFDKETNKLGIDAAGKKLEIDINPVLKNLDSETPEINAMTVNKEENGLSARFILNTFSADRKDSSLKVSYLQGYLLLKKND